MFRRRRQIRLRGTRTAIARRQTGRPMHASHMPDGRPDIIISLRYSRSICPGIGSDRPAVKESDTAAVVRSGHRFALGRWLVNMLVHRRRRYVESNLLRARSFASASRPRRSISTSRIFDPARKRTRSAGHVMTDDPATHTGGAAYSIDSCRTYAFALRRRSFQQPP